MKSLREFIENEKAKQAGADHESEQLQEIMEMLEKEDFTLTEYDDTVARQLIESVKAMSKETVQITFKGGFEVTAAL